MFKSDMVGQDVGVLCLYACQEVGVAMYKMFAFLFSLTYMPTLPEATFWKCVIYDWWATAPTIRCKLYVTWHFVHISNISLNYSHLKSTRPVASKSKVLRPGRGCDVHVGVSRNKTGVASDVFCFSALICIYNHILRPNILRLWKRTLWKCGYCNTHKVKRSSARLNH